MPPTTPRPTPAERRALIEAAATRLFARRGYAATTVDDIVDAAGITKPMLYRHFESKQALCVDLLERYRAELVAAPLSQFTPGADDLRAQLASMLDAWLEHIEQHPDAAHLLFTPIRGDAEVERVQQEVHDRQSATQTALLQAFVPGLGDEQAAPLGEALRSALGSVAIWWLGHPGTPRSVPAAALLHLTEGTISALKAATPAPEEP